MPIAALVLGLATLAAAAGATTAGGSRTGPTKEQEEMDTRPLAGARLGFFGKGGAGKSTVVVLLARALRDRGYQVVVVYAPDVASVLSDIELIVAATE